MKTYCVFQQCDEHSLNRLVDRICASVQNGIDFYHKVYPNSEVLFIPHYAEDMPESIQFFDPIKGISVDDLYWLREHQCELGLPITRLIEINCENGNLDITNGMIVYVEDEEVLVHTTFLVELRHVYE